MARTVFLADLAFLDLSAPRLLGFAESQYIYAPYGSFGAQFRLLIFFFSL